MKKILLVLVSTISLFLCLGCSIGGGKIKEISYDDFADMVQNKESFVIYVGSATCSHCEEFRPVLEEVAHDNNLIIYYIDNSKLTDAQKNQVSKKVDLKGTPTLCNIKEGKAEVSTNLVGSKDYDQTVEYFKTIGYIE